MLILACYRAVCYDLRSINSLHEDQPIMSFTLNESGTLALLNVATQVPQRPCIRPASFFRSLTDYFRCRESICGI